MGIIIRNGGFFTTVQDVGRIGYQQYGYSVTGAIDPRSFIIANMLIDNSDDEAVLEVTLLGPHIEFDESNIIAITGADFSPTVNGKPIPMYRAVLVNKGDTLSFGMQKTGCRSFIAFAGGLDVTPVLGSASTYTRAKLGGFNGRNLAKGDCLGFKAPVTTLKNFEMRSMTQESFAGNKKVLHVILGPQEDYFTKKGLYTFLNTTYKVSNQFDRMGCRLDGEVIEHVTDGNIISDGISMGAIQVPSNGLPIILLVDRQSVGGYTKIATICTVNLPIIAQAKMGDEILFETISVQEAQKLLRDERDAIDAQREAFNCDYPKNVTCTSYYNIKLDGIDLHAKIEELE